MGFIDWHGTKQDNYEEVVEYAKMKEIMDAENFGNQEKKKADAEYFGAPEFAKLGTKDVLKLVMKEKKALDMLYAQMTKSLSFDEYEAGKQLYDASWLYLVDSYFIKDDFPTQKRTELLITFLNDVFKCDSSVTVEDHLVERSKNKRYNEYLLNAFELKLGKEPVFWKWIGYLDSLSKDKSSIEKFVKIYLICQKST